LRQERGPPAARDDKDFTIMTSNASTAPRRANLLTRSDTMLGICQGLGEDLGFNPDLLRVAFGIALIWTPWLTLGIYLGLGLLVVASRLMFPSRASQPPAEATPAGVAYPVSVEANDPHELALAA
jgi:phage shock protein C